MNVISRIYAHIKDFFCSLLDIAENFHYLILAIAVLFGGAWTLYTFDALNQKEKALQELDQTEQNLKKAKLELKDLQDKIDGTDSSFIEISHEQIKLSNGNIGVIVNVLVQNTGTNDVDMKWKKSPLSVYKVETRNGDEQRLSNELTPKIYDDVFPKKKYLQNLYLFVGAKKHLSFYVELSDPGLYYLMFKAKTDKELSDKLKKAGKSNGIWFSSKYIYLDVLKENVKKTNLPKKITISKHYKDF
ncbi:hypothetical protein MHO82_20980 [Vibrio sp. Of7-15]|uniref:hypothetical protein n=1 Tax=Vibrio sp. Of7-15 TaxID=2724879 RepID=UPI001EF3050D|nr:hypothetical protein [Vibrio sp. Of7-15]MCG7499343.1 hypothetical protein [Vibrio sp. Of7-15]